MNITAIIQARMGSTRLPGKVLFQLMGKSVLSHVIERLQAVDRINKIVVATTEMPSDDPIVKESNSLGIEVYRGSESDVLSRYYEAAILANADGIVRITSDCPLIDPEVTREVICTFIENRYDYVSNCLQRSFPRGLDTEVFSMGVLKETFVQAKRPEQREHVTPYIYTNAERFRLYNVLSAADYSRHRWTLDTIEDWNLIVEIYKHLYNRKRVFSWHEVIELLERYPDLIEINQHIEQKRVET
ncbi:cytidylyltransferase domain-containing protein [Paenibacillus abyssi]|uniref:Spore coat protein n=1 Tax=Paenibacillus abyssi TaxID=1340531 RepID=A0A917CK79_9BACL|nr:glycosyltransferase family protein [Paenibacillus abyssi]GGF91425.1 spore coat protein [Paenibacillus abyssi]